MDYMTPIKLGPPQHGRRSILTNPGRYQAESAINLLQPAKSPLTHFGQEDPANVYANSVPVTRFAG